MNRLLRISAKTPLQLIGWIGLLLLVGIVSCSKSSAPSAAAIASPTGHILSAADVRLTVPGAICGDTSYAEVSSAWLHSFYDDFRQQIFDQGVTKWDEHFDCNHFAGYYADLAQTKFYLANFSTWTKAQSLAVGSFWYISPAGPHAIVVAITERGVIFIEPQTGQELQLTQAQRNSSFIELF